jgi:hypothetical protein
MSKTFLKRLSIEPLELAAENYINRQASLFRVALRFWQIRPTFIM